MISALGMGPVNMASALVFLSCEKKHENNARTHIIYFYLEFCYLEAEENVWMAVQPKRIFRSDVKLMAKLIFIYFIPMGQWQNRPQFFSHSVTMVTN